MLINGSQTEITPVSLISQLLGDGGEATGHSNPGAAFFSALGLLALLIGYLVKAISSTPVEYLAHPPNLWNKFIFQRLSRDELFPYTARHRDHSYFSIVQALVARAAEHYKPDLPGYQPFEAIKRLLKLRAPAMWEEAEQKEAQVRLLASLFLVSQEEDLGSGRGVHGSGSCTKGLRLDGTPCKDVRRFVQQDKGPTVTSQTLRQRTWL